MYSRPAVPRGRVRRALVLAFVLCPSLGGGAGAAERHVVLISIDGLRPAFYLDDAYGAPNLRALLKAGAHARAAEPVFPSLTYPGHASIVTTEKYLGTRQDLQDAPCDHLGLRLPAA